jgi:hypothetical protein
LGFNFSFFHLLQLKIKKENSLNLWLFFVGIMLFVKRRVNKLLIENRDNASTIGKISSFEYIERRLNSNEMIEKSDVFVYRWRSKAVNQTKDTSSAGFR